MLYILCAILTENLHLSTIKHIVYLSVQEQTHFFTIIIIIIITIIIIIIIIII